ncbi:MAG TPA: response regulator [Verrucomicrobiae bacterium]|nr:response regulator [Verrucomicrobiae bacterium]
MNDSSQPGAKPSVLIVEDSLTQAVFLRRILEKGGYDVTLTADGQQALEQLESRLPDLIISDVMMPNVDGYTLCQRAKASEKFRSVPFMLLTALSEPTDIFKGLESGADFYCIKPYDGAKMLERVNAILDVNSTQYRTNKHGTEITYGGQKYTINAGRGQVLDLLLATFENIVRKNGELIDTNRKLTEALEANKTLRGLIPICGYCKKIRDDRGFWDQVECFVSKHSEARFSHGICPQCFEKTMKELGLKDEKSETVSA